MIKNKPTHVLIKQRKEFLKTCPICGKLPRYIQGTNVVVCDHEGTKYSNVPQYNKLLNNRGHDIAAELFGEGRA